MPQAIIIFAQTALATVGYTAAALVGGSVAYSTALYIGAAVIVGGSVVAKKAMSLFEMEMPQVDSDVSRQSTAKTTVAPQKIIYGEALVSGPISYIALAGANNADLYQTIVLAGHEVNAITDIHFDDEIITNAQIAAGLNNGSNTAGDVTGGTFGPIDSNTICVINKHLGAASQASDPMLTNKFALYTSAHRGEGIAYLAMKWTLDEDSAEVWEKYSPGNVKALVQGKQVYDPRLEVAANNNDATTAGDSPNNTAYIAYSTNPALCVTDYLIDQTLGMGIDAAKIDWAAVITAANGCDVDVDVPNNATQKRFTANGVLFGTDSHQKNINKLLSAMNGRLIYSNGKYIVKAGIYEAATEDLTEDDLIGAIQIKTSLERSDRFNTIRGIFVDAAANNKSTEFPKVQLADAVNRDNQEVLEKEIQLPMVSDSYQAQRIANKLIQLSDQQKIISFPANLSALRITAGDRVRVTVEELSWNQKVFECIGWTFSDEGGVNLTLREDSSLSYDDPLPAAYSQISSDGVIADGFRGVPSPSGLTATAGLKNIELSWVNPGKPSDFGTVYVYASKNANFSSAIKIGETDGTQFVHDASNKTLLFSAGLFNIGDSYTIRDVGNTNWVAIGATAPISAGVVFTATGAGSGTGKAWETIVPGDLRYYWVRAVKNIGTDDASRSGLEPPNDPNTTVFATVGAVEWVDVADPTIGIDINNDTISINTGVANTTTGQAVATSGIEAGTTVTQGGITMNQGGSIKGGQSAYNSGTGFFLGYDTNAYKFSIGNAGNNSLAFDGTNLAVTGTVNASAGAFTGDVSTDSKFIAGSGATSATMDGGDQNYRIYAGGATPDLSSFKVDSDGVVTATRLVVTRPDDLSAVIFDSARDGLVGIGLASISQDTGIVVQAPSVELTSQTNTVSVVLTASQTLTLETILALPTAKKNAGNYTTAQYPASITATMQYSTNSGSSWSTFGAAVVLGRTADPSPSDTSKFGVLTAQVDGNGRTGYRRDVHAIDNINNIHFIKSVAGFTAGSYLFRVQLSFVAGSSPDTDYEPNITGNRTLQFGTDGAGFTVDQYGVITDSPSGTATIGYVQANYVALDNGNTITVGSGETNTFEDESSNEILVVSDTEVVARNLFRATWNGAQPTSTKIIRVTNPTGTAERFSVTEDGSLTTSTLGVTGNAIITGDLTVNGTTTTVNTDNLTVKDPNITLNYATGDSSSTANNAGITIQDAVNSTTDASILWKTASDTFEFSHGLTSGAITSSGLITADRFLSGIGSAASPAFQVGDTNSGFYDSGANMVGVSLNGVLEYDFQPTGLYLNYNGIFDAGDITANDITVTRNGTALTVNSGTTNVAARFESGDANVYIDLQDSDSGTYGALLGHNAANLFFVADSSVNTKMSLSPAGNATFAGTISSGAITSGTISTGSGTGGALALTDLYSPSTGDHLANIGWLKSSGGTYLGYGAKQSGSATWVSTYDNFSGKRNYVAFDEDSVTMVFAAAQQTAVGSAITGLTERFKFDLNNGVFQVNGTAVIDGSRNITAGTISSGANNGIIKEIGGDISLVQGSVGLRINDAASALSPTTASANNDAAVDLGASNIRFRNLYLSGTISSASITTSGQYQRTASNVGHFEGSYNNVGANGTHTNPIYTIGSSYNPALTTLGNMYGVGFCSTAASFISFAGQSNWGMYVAADGDARIWLDGSNGTISSKGSIYAAAHVYAAQNLYLGDGSNGYFYSDTAGRTAFRSGDLYIQTSVTNYYNYATNQYHGNTSGDSHFFRGNALSGNSWSIGTTGVAAFTNGSYSGTLTTGGDIQVNGNQVRTAGVPARVKYSVWTGQTYGIGMQSGYTFGPINNDYVMSFQMNNDSDRGFWWGDASHTNAQGAMALTTDGYLTVASGMRVGYGESDTTKGAAGLQVNVELELVGRLNMAASTNADIDLNRSAFITFYGDSARNHGIGSRSNTGAAADDIRINSYGAVYINLDSNSNNSSGADFVIGRHGSDVGSMATLVTISGEDGDITTSGNVTAFSDARLKKDVKTLDGKKVLEMRGVSFTKDGREGSGVIAQELELVASELVITAKDEMGTKSVAYGNLVGYLIENAKQQQSEIDKLKKLVKKLME